ncbi:MAG: SirB2 family protein [Rudaea sp.]
MLEFYLQIKIVHVACVMLSGSLFTARGLMMLAGSRYTDHRLLRFASYAIDTTLLVSALLLVSILRQYPFVQSWLTVKVLLLIVYIVLGVFALRRGRTRAVRGGFLAAALLVFAFIVSVAITHNPRGWFIYCSA